MTYPSDPRLPFPPASGRQSAADQDAPYILPAAQPAPWTAPPTPPIFWSPPVPRVPAGPDPMRVPRAPSSLPLTSVVQAPPERRSSGSRASTVALLLATLVATGGVSFAIGRWSTGEAGSGSSAIAAGPAIDFAAAGAGGFPDSPPDAAPAGLGTAVEATAASDTKTSTDEAAAQPDSGWSDTGPPAASGTARDPDGAAAQLEPSDAAGEDPSGLVGQAPSAGGGPSAGDGPPAGDLGDIDDLGDLGDLGGFPGFGRGIEGRIRAVNDGQLTFESSDGTSSTVLVDASTEVLRREVGGIDALEVGDAVRIVPGLGAGPRGALAPRGDAATSGDAGELAASQVVVLESGGA